MNEGALIPVRTMDAVLNKNINLAKELKEYLIDAKKGVEFNDKRFIEFAEWQTLANAYDVDVETDLIGAVEIFNDQGIKARGQAVHTPTGKVVGYAEAMCFKSEPGRKNHNWNQIGSMAQTRAGAKALKNAMGWVLELAGISATPLEEMENIISDEGTSNGNGKTKKKPKSAVNNDKEKTLNNEVNNIVNETADDSPPKGHENAVDAEITEKAGGKPNGEMPEAEKVQNNCDKFMGISKALDQRIESIKNKQTIKDAQVLKWSQDFYGTQSMDQEQLDKVKELAEVKK